MAVASQAYEKDHIWFGLAVISFFIVGCFTLHHSWLISDVNSYYNQALAILSGSNNIYLTDPVSSESVSLLDAPYPLGNASWLALCQLLLGKEFIFLGSLFCSIFGIYFTKRTLDYAKLPSLAIYLLFFTVPLQFYTNTLMSGMPSFLLASIFLCLLLKMEDGWLKWFVLCALAVFSAWFRETNVLLLGGICLIHFMQERKYFLAYVLGSFLGFLPRLVSHQLMFDDPLHFMFSESFTAAAFMSQLDLYLFIELILFPLGLLVAIVYSGSYKLPMKLSVLGFCLFYTAYAYDATLYSGFVRGSLVNSRFLLPLAPFFVYMLASWLTKFRLPIWLFPLGSLAAILFTVMCQITVYNEHNKHHEVSQYLQEKYSEEVVLYDMTGLTNITRYINTLATNMPYRVDVIKVTDSNYMTELFTKYDKAVIFMTENVANTEKMSKTQVIASYMNEAAASYKLTKIEEIPVENGLSVVVFELGPK